MADERSKLLPSNGDAFEHQTVHESDVDIQSAKLLRVDDILNFIGFGLFQAIAFCLSAVTSFAFGLEITAFAFLEIPLRQEWNLSGLQYAILPSVTGVSNIIGGFLYAYLCDRYGRIWPYVLVVINVGVFGFASAFSPNFPTLIALRSLASIGVGGAGLIMYSTLIEFLPVRNRGKVLVLVLIALSFGNCLTGGLAWWLIPTYPDNGWRYLLIALSVPCFIAAAFRLIFYVQSPRYLLAQGRYKEARKVFDLMARFNGKNLNQLFPESSELEDSIDINTHKSNKTKWAVALLITQLFKPTYLRTTICLSITFVTEINGLYGSSLFLPGFLKKLGVSNPYFAAFVGYLGQIPGILLVSIIVEWKHIGRINTLRFFSALAVVMFLVFAFVQTPVVTAVLTVLIYFSMYPMAPLLYAYASESYPTEIRSIALGYLNNLTAVFAIVSPLLSGYAADVTLSWLYPTVWAGIFFVQLIASLFLKHETLGRNLVDITSK